MFHITATVALRYRIIFIPVVRSVVNQDNIRVKGCLPDGQNRPFHFNSLVEEGYYYRQFRFVALTDTACRFVHFRLPGCGYLRSAYPVAQYRIGNIVQFHAGFEHPQPKIIIFGEDVFLPVQFRQLFQAFPAYHYGWVSHAVALQHILRRYVRVRRGVQAVTAVEELHPGAEQINIRMRFHIIILNPKPLRQHYIVGVHAGDVFSCRAAHAKVQGTGKAVYVLNQHNTPVFE